MPRRAVAALAFALLLAACAESTPDPAADCGLPEAEPGADATLVPEQFVIPEAEVLAARGHDRGVDAVLGVSLGVQDALARYQDAVGATDFDVIAEDNEGFEAEVYLREAETYAALQIRRTVCTDVSIVFYRTARRDDSE